MPFIVEYVCNLLSQFFANTASSTGSYLPVDLMKHVPNPGIDEGLPMWQSHVDGAKKAKTVRTVRPPYGDPGRQSIVSTKSLTSSSLQGTLTRLFLHLTMTPMPKRVRSPRPGTYFRMTAQIG